MAPPTIQQPDLIYDRKVPVLRHHFRQDEVYYGGERTTRKIANTVTLSMSAV